MYRSGHARPNGRLSRRGRRLLLLASLLGLVLLLVQTSYAPFQHPRSHLFLLTGGLATRDASSSGPLDYVIEDFSDFVSLEPALYRGPLGQGLTISGSLRDRHEMSGLGDQIATLPVRHDDVLLIFVSAAGISTDGTPFLVASEGRGRGGRAGEEFRYPLRTLLRQIQTSPARHRLLILDAGRGDFDPAAGMLVNQFPRLLRDEVEQLKDPKLSVLCSHDEQQRSHLSPALRRSVFSFFVARGLQGAADLNGDRVVRLEELELYVTQQVAAWVQRGSGGRDAQTPFLVRWSGAPFAGKQPLLAVTSSSRANVRDQHLATIAANRRESQLATAGVDSTRRQANRLVRAQIERVRPQSRFSRLANYYAPRFWRERGIWFGGGDSAKSQGEEDLVLELAMRRDSEFDREDRPGSPSHADSTAPLSSSGGSERKSGASAEASADSGGSVLATSPGAGRDTSEGSGSASNGNRAANLPTDSTANGDSAQEPSIVDPRAIEVLLHEVWALRDRLETVPNFPYRPQDYAPHLWRAFQRQLLLSERLFRTGPDDSRAELLRTLTLWRDELQAFENVTERALDRPTTILQRLQVAHPSRLDTLSFAHSLAMQELAYRRRGQPLPDDLSDLRTNLDGLIVDGSWDAFTQWVDGLSETDRRMPEIRLATALRTRGHLDWPTIQLALRVARTAEQAVADGGRFASWLEQSTLTADQRRQAAERRLLDGLDTDLNVAQAELNRLYIEYRDVDQQRRQLERASALRNDLLLRLPEYLSWFQRTPVLNGVNSGIGPQFEDLKRLLTDLRQLRDHLDDVHLGSVADVVAISERLRMLRETLERPLEEEPVSLLATPPVQGGDSWQIEQILSNTLARAEARQRLIRSAAEIDRSWAADFILPETSPHLPPRPQLSIEDWQRIEQLMELETLSLQLAIPRGESGHVLGALVKRIEAKFEAFQGLLESSENTSVNEAERWRVVAEFGAEVRGFHQSLPGHLQAVLARHNHSPPIGAGPSEVSTTSPWGRLAWWLDPRDESAFPDIHLSSRDERDSARKLFIWQYRRALSGRIGQDPGEFSYLTHVASDYARVAGSELPPSTDLSVPPRRLHVEGSTSLSLALRQESELELVIGNESTSREDVWLVLEYADDLLDVRPRGASQLRWYTPQELSPDQARLAVAGQVWRDAASTIDPDLASPLASRPPSLTLRGGQSEIMRVRIRRRAESPHPTRLVVTAFSKSEAVRWTLPIHLPAPRDIQLRVTGNPGSWSAADSHWTLHPYPNRITRFQIDLRCQPQLNTKVDVELFVPRGPLPNLIPGAVLGLADADEFLRTLSLSSPLREVRGLTLAGTEGWQAIPWAEPESSSNEAQTTGPSDGTQGGTETDSSETRVVESLLVVVTDLERQQRMFSRLDVMPQKPTRFVQPRVGYDPTRQRLDIDILPQDRELLPPEGVRVRAEFAAGLPESGERRLDTILLGPPFRGHMFAEIPSEAQRQVTLYLHVDDYPRAFIYQVPLDRFAIDIPPADQALRVHVSNLPLGTVYRAPAERIPVELEIDVPRGAFRNTGDFVEVGIDRSRNRTLWGERTKRLLADRHVVVTIPEITSDGVLALSTQVTDQRVELTHASDQSGRANLLARVMVDGREVWSDPVEIILDGTGPRFLTAELTTDGVVAMGTEVGVVARVDDRSLSGVARVEMAIDRARSGQLPDEERVEAQLDATGAWRANLPTDGLSRGSYNILLQATDQVGNAGELRRIRVQLVSEDDLKPDTSALRGEIRGSVLFGRKPRESFPVTLERLPDENEATENAEGGDGDNEKQPEPIFRATRTDAEGVFLFRDLPAGSYQLRAAGIVHNRPRSAETTVKLAPPRVAPPVELTLP